MTRQHRLLPVKQEPGRVLYQSVRDAVRKAVDAGLFKPGEKIPSTQILSEQMRVSLVTAHRALQELVVAGVLHRSQGKGTFVNPRYTKLQHNHRPACIGLVIERGGSIGDYYHGQIFEGVRQAAKARGADLVVLSYGEDARKLCDGYLILNPRHEELRTFIERGSPRRPVIAVGARPDIAGIPSIDVDNFDLARQAVSHLHQLGHRTVGFVGGDLASSNSRDRYAGFQQACREFIIPLNPRHIFEAQGWQLSDAELANLSAIFRTADPPTAIFAAGYYFSLGVYTAAHSQGLTIPNDLSVVAVDDPPSATYLSPALTTVRQPLFELGRAAIVTAFEALGTSAVPVEGQILKGKLVIRKSTTAPRPR